MTTAALLAVLFLVLVDIAHVLVVWISSVLLRLRKKTTKTQKKEFIFRLCFFCKMTVSFPLMQLFYTTTQKSVVVQLNQQRVRRLRHPNPNPNPTREQTTTTRKESVLLRLLSPPNPSPALKTLLSRSHSLR